MSETTYFVTGAGGFLASTIIRQLVERGSRVVAGVRSPGNYPALADLPVPQVVCDVCSPSDLVDALADLDAPNTVVIHAAGVVSISDEPDPALTEINVNGTARVIEAVRTTGAKRLVFVSSVHALPEVRHAGDTRAEVDHFDPDEVASHYGKSKAISSQLVLDATDIDRVIVHPSGLFGPLDFTNGHVTQLIDDLMWGRLPMITSGGHDTVDVRDVAAGTIAAADRGRNGATYLLTGEVLSIPWMAREVANLMGTKPPPSMPLWLLALIAGPLEYSAKRRGAKPIVTRSSLHSLRIGSVFTHDLATAELGYTHRPPSESMADTVAWLKERDAAAT